MKKKLLTFLLLSVTVAVLSSCKKNGQNEETFNIITESPAINNNSSSQPEGDDKPFAFLYNIINRCFYFEADLVSLDPVSSETTKIADCIYAINSNQICYTQTNPDGKRSRYIAIDDTLYEINDAERTTSKNTDKTLIAPFDFSAGDASYSMGNETIDNVNLNYLEFANGVFLYFEDNKHLCALKKGDKLFKIKYYTETPDSGLFEIPDGYKLI